MTRNGPWVQPAEMTLTNVPWTRRVATWIAANTSSSDPFTPVDASFTDLARLSPNIPDDWLRGSGISAFEVTGASDVGFTASHDLSGSQSALIKNLNSYRAGVGAGRITPVRTYPVWSPSDLPSNVTVEYEGPGSYVSFTATIKARGRALAWDNYGDRTYINPGIALGSAVPVGLYRMPTEFDHLWPAPTEFDDGAERWPRESWPTSTEVSTWVPLAMMELPVTQGGRVSREATIEVNFTEPSLVIAGVDSWVRHAFAPPMEKLPPGSTSDTGVGINLLVEQVHVTARYVPPRYRLVYRTAGMWNLRQRQSLTGNAGGWPLRQRQTGGATGSWPLRQRQTGT